MASIRWASLPRPSPFWDEDNNGELDVIVINYLLNQPNQSSGKSPEP